MSGQTSPPPDATLALLERGPYVGAEPFGVADKLFFHGRDREARQLANTVAAGTLTVVYGESGVGKTSLLNARLPDELDELDPGWAARVITISEWQPGFFDRLCASAGHKLGRKIPDRSLAADLIAAAHEADTPIALVLDQFEEYFLYHPNGDAVFETELAGLANLRNGHVRVVLSLRSDGLFLLDRLRWRIPDIFRRLQEIQPLNARGAAAAIIKPLREYKAIAKRAGRGRVSAPRRSAPLVQALITGANEATLAARLTRGGRGGIAEQPDRERIVAPFLQLALRKLWQAETPWLIQSGSVLSFRLEILRRVAGRSERDASHDAELVGDIVQQHVDQILGALTADRQQVCVEMLDRMITPAGSKVAATPSTIRHHVPPRLRPLVDDLLEELARGHDNRLLRKTAGRTSDDEPSYEIVHDMLAVPLLAWIERGRASQDFRRRRGRLMKIGGGVVVLAAFLVGLYQYDRQLKGEVQQKVDLGQIARQAADPGNHDDARVSILVATEALRHIDKLPPADILRLRALIGRSLDGFIDSGIAYSSSQRILKSRSTLDGREMVVISEAAGSGEPPPDGTGPSTAAVAEPENRKQLVQWVSLTGDSAIMKSFDAPGSAQITVSDDGGAAFWWEFRKRPAVLTVVYRDRDAQVSVELPENEILDSSSFPSGNDLITTSHIENGQSPGQTPEQREAAGTRAHGPPVHRRWTFPEHKPPRPEILNPSSPPDVQRIIQIGPAVLAAIGKTDISINDDAKPGWQPVFPADKTESRTIEDVGSNLNGSVLWLLTRTSSSLGEYIFLDMSGDPAQELARIDSRDLSSGAFARTGPYLFAASRGGSLRVLDLRLNSWGFESKIRSSMGGDLRAGGSGLYFAQGDKTIRRMEIPRMPDVERLPRIAEALVRPKADEKLSRPLSANLSRSAFDYSTSTLVSVTGEGFETKTLNIVNAKLGQVRSGKLSDDISVGAPLSVAVNPGASMVLIGTNVGDVVLVDGATRKSRSLYEFKGADDVSSVALSADGTIAAAVGDNGTIRLIPLSDPARVVSQELRRPIGIISLSGDAARLLVVDGVDRVQIYDVRGDGLSRIGRDIEPGDEVRLAALDKAGARAATVTKRGDVDVWDVATGIRLGHWSIDTRVVSLWLTDDSAGVLLGTGKRVTWTVRDPAKVEVEARALNLCPLTPTERARLGLPDWSAPPREARADSGMRCRETPTGE